MDLNKVIRDLHDELEKLNQVILAVKTYESTGTMPVPRRRGRKAMSEEERQVVSERMKRYWAKRREGKASAGHS